MYLKSCGVDFQRTLMVKCGRMYTLNKNNEPRSQVEICSDKNKHWMTESPSECVRWMTIIVSQRHCACPSYPSPFARGPAAGT